MFARRLFSWFLLWAYELTQVKTSLVPALRTKSVDVYRPSTAMGTPRRHDAEASYAPTEHARRGCRWFQDPDGS